MFDTMEYVCKAIAKAFEPFHVGKITAWQKEDFRDFTPLIRIEVENLRGYYFTYRPSNKDLLTLSPQAIAVAMAQEAYNYFFYRPLMPIDDHIILGEN